MRAFASATVGLVGVAAAGGAEVCPAAGDGEAEDFIGCNLCGHTGGACFAGKGVAGGLSGRDGGMPNRRLGRDG